MTPEAERIIALAEQVSTCALWRWDLAGIVLGLLINAAFPQQIDATSGVHVVCAAPCSGVILWEGDAARADYADGQWTVCPTSKPCASTATRVRTSAACVVTPLVEVGP